MKLRKFKTNVFAGINKQKLEFEDGLNVILGKNEAGKSTIINAIYALLFKEAKIRLNYSEDREFKNRFFPYPDGDHIHGLLEFEIDNKNYLIEKKWSREEPYQYLEFPDGRRIENEKKLKNEKRKLLKFNKGTYKNIVFTRQRGIKSSIKRIIESDEVVTTINNFLRKAVMELDGVSIDKLNKKIDNEINDLLKKWDINNNRPSNTDRDVHNPYQMGYGLIYEAYINKEKIAMEMEESKKLEKDYEERTKILKELRDERKSINERIEKLSEIEDDIFLRGNLEAELDSLYDKSERIKKINRKWPVVKNELAKEKNKLVEYEKELKKLKNKKIKAKKQNELKKIKEKINKIEDKKKKIVELKSEKNSYKKIDKNDLAELRKYKNNISKAEASLEAAKLLAKINFSSSKNIKVQRGINDKEILDGDENIKANGYLRIITDNIDIEIESAEIDFEKLNEEYKKNKKYYDNSLDKLSVKNLSKAEDRYEKLKNINSKIKNIKDSINEILENDSYKDLKAKIENFSFEEVESLENINKNIENLRENKISDLKLNIKTKKEKIKDWKEEFDNYDLLMDKLGDMRSEIKTREEKLQNLAELPEEFETAAEFKKELTKLRKNKEVLDNKYNIKREKLLQLENQLGDNSYEELKKIYEEKKRIYNILVNKAKKVIKIKNTINKKLNEMDENSLEPLVESFSKKLNILTENNYKSIEIEDDFEIKIKNQNNKNLPANLDLLSYGTYDAVALALRFSVFENLFANSPSFIVLDDCLVNLDPERRKKAINLINKFQNRYQIIFSTCSPQIAKDLGGNIIKL